MGTLSNRIRPFPFVSFVLCKLCRISISRSLGVIHSRFRFPICDRWPWIPPAQSYVSRDYSTGSVNLVLSGGKVRFETKEVDPPKKRKFMLKKRLKMKRKREKQARKDANKKDPRRLAVKFKKQKFANTAEKIKFRIEKAKIKEERLLERLKLYEVHKSEQYTPEPDNLSGEERFYMKKMAQKGSNYVPVGRRGVFGGVILNMHLHWKKHETVKVICKPCKPGQLHEYAKEIARLSGGIPIQTIRNDTIVFYRGKDYIRPRIMSPVDTLSKKKRSNHRSPREPIKALEKSKYIQSLETVRHYIAVSQKELELYYRHIALYGDPRKRDPFTPLRPLKKLALHHSQETGEA